MAGKGRPQTFRIEQLVRMLLVKYICNLSYRQCEQRVRSDLVLRRFCRYSLFEPVADHSTLNRFETYIRTTCPDVYFQAALNQIDSALPGQRQAWQIGDTFALQADAAKESLTRLLRHGSERLLASLGASDSQRQIQLMCALDLERLFGKEGEATVKFEQEPEARAARLLATVRGTLELLRRTKTLYDPLPEEAAIWVGHLEKVLADEVILTLADTGELGTEAQTVSADAVALAAIDRLCVKRRSKRGSYRIGSMSDTDASYRKHNDKSDLGYNVSVAADQFVRAIHTATGAEPDEQGIVPLLTQQAAPPAQLVYDQAAGHGKTYFLVDQCTHGQSELVARPVVYKQRSKRFDPRSFTPSTDGLALTCPNEVATETVYRSRSGDGWNFRFSAAQCANCPLWQQCRDPKTKPDSDRAVFISDYRRVHAQALARAATPEFVQALAKRPHIERIISHLVNHNGARRARVRGLEKVCFQMKMCATAYNLKKWVKLTAGMTPVRGRGLSHGG